MKRPEELKDYFKVECRKCGSENVWLHVQECARCNDSFIEARCEDCGNNYEYHKAGWIEEPD